MSLKYMFGYILITTVIYTNVASWTIDLPEVRRNLFEKSEKDKNIRLSNEKMFYDNVNPNSVHHLKSGHGNYPNFEKEVHIYFLNGNFGRYLKLSCNILLNS